MSQTPFAPLSLTMLCLLTPLTLGAADRDPERSARRPAEPLTAAPMLREPARDVAQENVRVRLEIELLKARIAELEARLKHLEGVAPPAPKPAPRAAPPQTTPRAPRSEPRFSPRSVPPGMPGAAAPAAPRPVPEGWQEREFNGMRFYIVPLTPDEAKPRAARAGAAKPAAPTTIAPQAPQTQPAQ